MICRACGGGRAHHSVPGDPCWCPTCQKLPESDRCVAWDPVAPARRFAASAKKAGRSRAAQSLPREGTFKRQVYDFVLSAGLAGLTYSELQYKTAKTASQVIATVVSLAGDGLLEDSGHARAPDLVSKEEKAWRVRTV